MECTDCHASLAEVKGRHAPNVKAPDCGQCHEDQAKAYKGSVHAEVRRSGNGNGARCWSCHGTHDIFKASDSRSHVFKQNLPTTCARCHKNPKVKTRRPDAAEHYLESLHGRALASGVKSAPACGDCHGSHRILKAENPQSSVHHSRVPLTCGKCHARVLAIYLQSVHGRSLYPHGIPGLGEKKATPAREAAGEVGGTGGPCKDSSKGHACGKGSAPTHGKREGAVCTDCHTAHDVIPPSRRSFKLAIDRRCGKCHADRLKGYYETYHGKANALGLTDVAACYDCHGDHDIYPTKDPRSTLSTSNRLATCRRCHPKATQSFTHYLAHATPRDKAHYPKLYWVTVAMVSLLLAVFGFYLVHTLLWVLRMVVSYVRNPSGFRKERAHARDLSRSYVRFRPVDRFCHMLLFSGVILLVATGMPLKFYSTSWARWIYDLLGGPRVAAGVHRLAAVLMLTAFVVHVGSLLVLLRRLQPRFTDPESGRLSLRRFLAFLFGPDSLVPSMQDVRDLWANLKYFVGLGPRPRFDRWTYWERFDYMAVFWGVAVIGASGAVMWAPEFFTRFLPGWSINIAHIIHSDEALLAAGFLFTFHYFHTHLRAEKFPMDYAMFSGRMSEAELKLERGRLYDRLKAAGALEPAEGGDAEWRDWRSILVPIGVLAVVLGLLLAVGIYSALWSQVFR